MKQFAHDTTIGQYIFGIHGLTLYLFQLIFAIKKNNIWDIYTIVHVAGIIFQNGIILTSTPKGWDIIKNVMILSAEFVGIISFFMI